MKMILTLYSATIIPLAILVKQGAGAALPELE
jgi:hypothetical protein